MAELRAAQSGGMTRPLMPRGGMRGAGRPTPYDRGDRFMGGGYGGRQLPMKGPRGGGMGGWGGGYDGYGGYGSYGGGPSGPAGMGYTPTTGTARPRSLSRIDFFFFGCPMSDMMLFNVA